MNSSITPIDISNIPALRRIIKEMKTTKQARLLKQDSENVAMLVPVGTALEQPTSNIWKDYSPSKVRQALKQSAGALAGVNRKELLEDIANSRSQETKNHTF